MILISHLIILHPLKGRKLYKVCTPGSENLGDHLRILPTTDGVTISEHPEELTGGGEWRDKLRTLNT